MKSFKATKKYLFIFVWAEAEVISD
jgi:hypothetical protein